MIAKIVISLALFASIAYSLEISDAAKAIIGECKKTFNIETDQIKAAINEKKLPQTEDGKCFLECVMEKTGLIKDGKLNVDRAKELNAMKLKEKPDLKEKADEVVDKCSAEVTKSEEKCGFGTQLMACALKHGKELGIPAPHIPE